MPAQSSVFPAFIRDEYQPGGGFAAFEQASLATADQVRRHFESSMSEVQRIAQRALAMPRNQLGSLDLGVGNYRAAAAAAEAHAIALREVATAAERAALASGDTTEATRLYVQAARAAAIEAEEAARGANQQVVAMERLQTELNQTRSGTQQVIQANRGLVQSQDQVAASSRAARFASVQLGQQFADVAIQAQMGVPVGQILIQQGTQAAFAMGQMNGALGRVGAFLSGPWGTALFIAVAGLTTFLGKTEETANRLDELVEKAGAFENASGRLGQVIDLSTGKFLDHNVALRETLWLQAQLALTTAEAAARQAERDLQRNYPIAMGPDRLPFAGILEGISSERFGGNERLQSMRDRLLTDPSQIQSVRRELQGMVQAGELARTTMLETLELFLEFSNAQEEIAARTAEIAALEGRGLDPRLRREDRNRPREDNRPQLAAQRLEEIQRLNEQWNEQPRLVDQAVQAVRRLDAILAEAQRRKLPRFDEMQREAEAAGAAIREGLIRQITEDFAEAPRLVQQAADAMRELTAAGEQFPELAPQIAEAARLVEAGLMRPYREFLEDQIRSYEIGQLMVQGREDEAQALSVIHQLEERLGPLGEERRQTIVDSVAALREQSRQLEIIRDQQQAYLNAADDLRGILEDTLANPPQGLSDLRDIGRDIGETFRRLNSRVIVERLFGDTFRQLEDFVTGRDQVRRANEEYATSIGDLRAELNTLSGAHRDQAESIDTVIAAATRFTNALDQAATRLSTVGVAAANDNPILGPTGRLPLQGAITKGFAAHVRDGSPGLDIDGRIGDAIEAPASGTVLVVGENARSGRYLVIDHGGGVTSSYSHLSSARVTQGSFVSAGDIIAAVGNTGRVQARGGGDGSHLHYRVKVGGQDVNPLSFRFPEQAAQAGNAVEQLADAATTAASATTNMGNSATAVLNEMFGFTSALRDGEQTIDIIAKGGKFAGPNDHLDPRNFMARAFTGILQEVLGPRLAKDVSAGLSKAMEGAAIGQMVGGIAQTIGIRQSNTGNQIGGALGNFIPGLPPGVGAAIGSIIGGTIGGLIKGTPRASSTIGFGADGQLIVASSSGTKNLRGQTNTAADSVISTVNRIAELFGGSVLSGIGGVSIGMRDGNYRVDPTGRGVTKTKKGAIDFGEDAEAAVRAAVLDLIKDGVIAGLRQGTQRLLQVAKDIDSGIEKALKFESVFTRLKEHLDPVGAALETLQKEFDSLRRIFQEAGATTEEFAQLEQLYQLEREQAIKQAGERMTSALRSLLDDLTVNNDALSLRERLTMARAKYDPLAADLAAGKKVDYESFADAARLVNEITREIYGSTTPYFQVLEEITKLTQKALSDQENLISIASGQTGTGGGGAANDNATPVVGAIDLLGGFLVGELGGRLDTLNANMGALLLHAAGGGRSRDLFFDPFDNF